MATSTSKSLQSDAGASATGKVSQQQSPRNTGSSVSVQQPGTITKAVRLAPVEVSKALQDGEKFIKWEDVSILQHVVLMIISYFTSTTII